MNADLRTKLSPVTIALHWIVALMIIGQIALAVYMEENDVDSLYDWHKSIGVTILAFALLRVLWRARSGWPPLVGDYRRWEKNLARLVHWLLIIGTVLMPISGMMMAGLGGHGIPLFGLELVAPNPDPANPAEMLPLNAPLAELGHALHEIGGSLLVLAVLLHIGGALKHELMDRDGTLRRMLGATVD